MKDSDLEDMGFNLATHNKATGEKTRFIDNTRLIAGVEGAKVLVEYYEWFIKNNEVHEDKKEAIQNLKKFLCES